MKQGPVTAQITVAADHHLVNRRFYRNRVWLPAIQVHQDIGSRSAWIDALSLIYDYDGSLYCSDGRPYRHDEITDIFEDQSNRWMGYFLEADSSGTAPKTYSRKFERLRLIELYCRLIEDMDWAG